MKTKNKILAVVEIAIVLCSVFFLAIPAITADQTAQKANANMITAASEDDYVLGIYGNANEDDTIDMRDLTYVKLIFFGKKPETELADAKYDGKINPLDFIQIKLIIVGKEKEITLVDTADKIVTVDMPVERVVALSAGVIETMRLLNAADKIVGVYKSVVTKEDIFFPEFSEYPIAGSKDPESIIALHPDVVFLYPGSSYDKTSDVLESSDITVIRVYFYKPESYVDETKKFGYIFGKRERAEEYLDFYEEGYMNIIRERVEKLSEEDKPKVYFEWNKPYQTCGIKSGYHQKVLAAGGNNIFSHLLVGIATVDPEEIINRDPEIIVKWYKGFRNWEPHDANELKKIRNELMERPVLERVSAVEDEKVYVITNTVTRGGFCIGIGYMAKWFHPELFSDFDPQAIHQEYLTRFQGLDIDLEEYGVFVHPEPS